MDRQIAAALIAHEDAHIDDDDLGPGPTPLGYTTDTYLLLAVVDALMGVQAAVIAAAGADPPPMSPMPRPATAVDVLREEQRLSSMQDLINLFAPPSSEDFS